MARQERNRSLLFQDASYREQIWISNSTNSRLLVNISQGKNLALYRMMLMDVAETITQLV